MPSKQLASDTAQEVRRAAHYDERVTGLSHNFYKYPARFSPQFARSVIREFSNPGDLVLDPFMGGGTSLVESRVLGRNGVGLDISSLATFVARVKTTILNNSELKHLSRWMDNLLPRLNCHSESRRANEWISLGYFRNVEGRKIWPIRKLLEQAIYYSGELQNERLENFFRCAVLKTGQWALDCKISIPSTNAFRQRLVRNLNEMCSRAKEFAASANEIDRKYPNLSPFRIQCINQTASQVDRLSLIQETGSPKLILTSPPYPGVHVLYHRWQVFGRRETPLPFWIANCRDGQGAVFYTMGNRKQTGLTDYFDDTYRIFSALVNISDRNTTIVQVVGFSNPEWQLDKYLDTLSSAGLTEITVDNKLPSSGRVWRNIPNRRWYADQQAEIANRKEVVLFHRLA